MKNKIYNFLVNIIIRTLFLFIGLFFSFLLFYFSIYFIDDDIFLQISTTFKSPYLISLTPYNNYILTRDKLKTEYSQLPYQEISIPKAKNIYRVYLFGGSQAMGEPYVHENLVSKTEEFKILDLPEQGGIATWLQKYFQQIHSNKKVEVINSAIGGGSLTEAIFAWLEVCSYDKPDLCIFLSGNNECNSDIYLFLRLVLKQLTFIKTKTKYNLLIDYLAWFYNRKIELIKNIAEQKKLNTYLLTVPNNIKDWTPFVANSKKNLKNPTIKNLKFPINMQNFKKKFNDINYDYPFIYHYFLGENYYKNKKYDKAWQQFTLAKDESLGQINVHSRFNKSIKNCKSDYIKSIDLEQLIRKYAKNGIPGYDLFFDACHMKLKANNFLAYEIAIKHAQFLNKSDIKLDIIDLKNFEVKRLQQLYKIKIQKWKIINKLNKFKNLGAKNKANVTEQYENALLELESVDMLISTIKNQDNIKK